MQQTPHSDPQLGTVVSELGPGWKPRIAGFFLVLVFAGLGVIGGVADDNVAIVVVSVLLALALIALIQFIASGTRVRVYVHGIERKARMRTKT